MLKDKASANIPRVNYAYPIYASASPQSGHLHTSSLLRASSTIVLVSYNPSFERRVLHTSSFRGVSNMLIARRRCSRINNLSSLHPFNHFTSVPVCSSTCATTRLQTEVPCYFISGMCPKIPHVCLRRIRTKRIFRVGQARILPLQIVRNELPVLNCHVNNQLKCVASVRVVPRRSCRRLGNLSILMVGTLQPGPRPARRDVSRTLRTTKHVNTGRACFVRVDRRTKLRTSVRGRLPPRMRFTCSKLRVSFWAF